MGKVYFHNAFYIFRVNQEKITSPNKRVLQDFDFRRLPSLGKLFINFLNVYLFVTISVV